MADNYGAMPQASKPYDYSDYYKPIRGSQMEDTTPLIDKIRSMFGALGIDQTPVNLNDPNASIGAKLRGGLAPALRPTATQADVRKSDMAMAGPGAVAPLPAAAPPAPVAPAPFAAQADVRGSDNAITANTPVPVVDGAWAPPHAAAPGIGAQLVAGPATTSVSSSRDANGNLVLTNAPPGPVGPGAVPPEFKAAPGSLASFYGAGMRMKQAAATDAAARATALKLPEFAKTGAEAVILSERMKLAAAETDPAKKAAILSGTSMPKDETTFPTGLQPLEGGYGVGAKGGKLTRVPITQPVTSANIDAALAGSMKGKTRAQVIQAYKDKGYDVSGIK